MKPTLTDSYGNQLSDEAWKRHRQFLIEMNIKYGPELRREQAEKAEKGA